MPTIDRETPLKMLRHSMKGGVDIFTVCHAKGVLIHCSPVLQLGT